MARKPKASAAEAGPATAPGVTIRHYCQGLGDCHLLSFPRPDGGVFRMLIDCGLHSIVSGGTDRIDKIAADIKRETGGRIDVLVVTHEHWDHVSGFTTAAEIFRDIAVGEVWMPWTEQKGDPLADQLDRYRGQALAALQVASNKLDGMAGLSSHMAGIRDGLDAILGFHFGARGDKVRAARDAAAVMAEGRGPVYLGPDSPPISITGLPNLRIYVLGPPRDKALLRLEERAAEMYQLGRSGWPLERALSAGLALGADGLGASFDDGAPFSSDHGHALDAVLDGQVKGDIAAFVADHYSGPAAAPEARTADTNLTDQSWRRIDADWLGLAADLAMQMDAGINNTSLVLAFEFVDSGRVLLFPGDAQIGSWQSWQSLEWTDGDHVVTAPDLLARTVYLKVSHHGSRNATPHRLGLDQMTNPDLSAFIPVNQQDAITARWHQMPFASMLTALAQHTASRVIRADDPWIAQPNGKPPFVTPSGSILALRNEGKGWVELDIG